MGRRWTDQGRTVRGTLLAGLMCGGALVASPAASAAIPPPETFTSIGAEQSYVVPSGITSLEVSAAGAPGGTGASGAAGGLAGPGARGALVTATLPVTPGQTLYVEVGGAGGAANDGAPNGGYNGGGLGGRGGGGGGGASDVRTVSCQTTCPGNSTSLQSRLVVAAGGGGGGGGFNVLSGGLAGPGDLLGASGQNGQANSMCTGGGGGAGGTSSAGGAAGAAASPLQALADCGQTSPATNGALGNGGAGGAGSDAGGGGGGGEYGGGGGGAGSSGAGAGGGGGGGGSSFGPGGSAFYQGLSGTAEVTLTPLGTPTAQVAPASLTFPSQGMSTVSAPTTVTISNTGNGALNVTGLSFTGPDPGDFFVGSSTCGGSVAAGASCQVTVFFVPQGQGARTGTLDVASNDPLSTPAVTLSGTGGPLAAGPPGPAGPKGATGLQGPPGTVVCRRDAVAMSLCSIIFAPGTFTVAPNAKSARYTIMRDRRIVAGGRAAVHHGVITLVRLRALRRGRYELVLTVGSGRHRRTVLKRTIRIR